MITEVTWYKAIYNSLAPCDKLRPITAHIVFLNGCKNAARKKEKCLLLQPLWV
ncbi:unnamed protein product [Staurois parvus]|uniref:Uncharacterized protein n=1 Tax=Staurois parvus TaxID=386267 RepID=A0ABN9D707_9NEOB|nr:unnamed protein product [Staurois parvus]